MEAETKEVTESMGPENPSGGKEEEDAALMKDVRVSVLRECRVLDDVGEDQVPGKASEVMDPENPSGREEEEDAALMKDIRVSVLRECRVLDDGGEDQVPGKASDDGANTSSTSKQLVSEDEEPRRAQETIRESKEAAEWKEKEVVDEEAGLMKDIRLSVMRECGVFDEGRDGEENHAATMVNEEAITETQTEEDTTLVQIPPRATHQASVSPTRLARGSGVQLSSRPGAFTVLGPNASNFGSSTEDIEAASSGRESIGNVPTGPRVTEEANGDMAIANLVNEEDEDRRPQALQVDPTERERLTASKRRKSLFQFIGAGVLLVVILIAVVVPIAVHRSKEGGTSLDSNHKPQAETTNETTFVQPVSIQEYILNLLPAATARGILLDMDETDLINATAFTPQQNAYKWLIHDQNLTNYSDERIIQRFALTTLFLSTGGPTKWRETGNWLSHDVHECDWFHASAYGLYSPPSTDNPLYVNESAMGTVQEVPCQNELYQHLWLNNNGLHGKIPEETFLLTNLKSIALDRNELSGSIATTIGYLTNLDALGSIPSEVGLLDQAIRLVLQMNLLTGNLPSEIALPEKLKNVSLWDNAITGTVPKELIQWQGLFDVDVNLLTSTIPTELGLSDLTGFSVNNNEISGTIPSEMGLLTNSEHLGLSGNKLNGTMPTELGLCKLSILEFHNNELTGTLPSELGQLSSLRVFVLGNNILSGAIPSELGQWTSMDLFASWLNQFSGTLPSELGGMRVATTFEVSEANLSGSIPSEMGLMENVEVLFLHDNTLTGTIPTEIGELSSLVNLKLSDNELSGLIPSEIGLLLNLKQVRLFENRMMGPVPSSLGLLDQLELLWLHNNTGLTGTIPTSLCNLTTWPDNVEENGGIHVDCESLDCSCDVCVCK
ncbi:LRR receptor-like serine threonine-protein kinase [Seminavis robusta]|uniref:LRR receptor-like serine threonine-protein kinase n=1 Tax=Seminavis robusta TaxID=568900 RepID=A0A9N8DGC6_9STRA|nr:LRR receptor-like serine threonine-protein kinase [Seminavis robusta]|eukprot:Sro144_g067010.1 LRR receptor-like serine threonine-protein kinase (895) ;mRNA; r:55242-58486